VLIFAVVQRPKMGKTELYLPVELHLATNIGAGTQTGFGRGLLCVIVATLKQALA